MEIFEIGKRYVVIYDDKGFKPIKKEILILKKDNNLLEVDTKFGREIINIYNIVRAGELKDGEHSN